MRDPGFQFTRRELLQLAASTLVLAAAFSFPLSCSYFLDLFVGDQCGDPGIKWDAFLYQALPVALAIVLAAFVLHELAHKLVAQHYGMWAEFRASTPGLLIALAVSAVLGVVVASPGAVLIYPPPRPRAARFDTEEAYDAAVASYETELGRQSGVISVAGPLVNLAFAGLSLPLWLATDQNPAWDIGLDYVGNVFQLALFVNVVLAAFNMLPIKPLDGSKIVRWNLFVFVGVWGVVLWFGWLILGGV